LIKKTSIEEIGENLCFRFEAVQRDQEIKRGGKSDKIKEGAECEGPNNGRVDDIAMVGTNRGNLEGKQEQQKKNPHLHQAEKRVVTEDARNYTQEEDEQKSPEYPTRPRKNEMAEVSSQRGREKNGEGRSGKDGQFDNSFFVVPVQVFERVIRRQYGYNGKGQEKGQNSDSLEIFFDRQEGQH